VIITFTNGQAVVTRKAITYVKLGTPGKRRWHIVYTPSASPLNRKPDACQRPVREVMGITPGVRV
jgi:hypothetical protein